MTMKHSIKYLLIPVLAMFMTGNCLSCSKDKEHTDPDTDLPDTGIKTYTIQVVLKAEEFVYQEKAGGTNELHFMKFVLTGVVGSGVTNVTIIDHMEINGITLNQYLQSASGSTYYYTFTFWKGNNEEIWEYIISKNPDDEIIIDVICVEL